MKTRQSTKNVLIGVCSGIAVYKVCSVVSRLVQNGYDAKIIMTPNATKLISPIVFSALTHNKVYTETFEEQWSDSHIALSAWADVFAIAPLTANTLSKLAHGIADDLLTTSVLAFPQDKPLVLFPSMNDQMWTNPMTQDNLRRLKVMKRTCPVKVVDPKTGRLVCGTASAVGRLPEPDEIVSVIEKLC